MQCHLSTWTNRGARRQRGGRRRHMELADVPLRGDLLGGLGEHLLEVREHPGRASTRAPVGDHPLSGLGHRTLGEHLLGG